MQATNDRLSAEVHSASAAASGGWDTSEDELLELYVEATMRLAEQVGQRCRLLFFVE